MNVERLKAVEDRLGVSLSGVVAEVKAPDHDGECMVKVRGEVTSLNGGALAHSVEIKMTAFNSAGDCLAAASTYVSDDSFFGIDSFEMSDYAGSPDIERVRVFVTKA